MDKIDCIYWNKKKSKKGCKHWWIEKCHFPNCDEFEDKKGNKYPSKNKPTNIRCEIRDWKDMKEQSIAEAKQQGSRAMEFTKLHNERYADLHINTLEWAKHKSEKQIRAKMKELDPNAEWEGIQYRILKNILGE